MIVYYVKSLDGVVEVSIIVIILVLFFCVRSSEEVMRSEVLFVVGELEVRCGDFEVEVCFFYIVIWDWEGVMMNCEGRGMVFEDVVGGLFDVKDVWGENGEVVVLVVIIIDDVGFL